MAEAGDALIMVTCTRGREAQCVTECYELFTQVRPCLNHV